jgi:hypothetical protein
MAPKNLEDDFTQQESVIALLSLEDVVDGGGPFTNIYPCTDECTKALVRPFFGNQVTQYPK